MARIGSIPCPLGCGCADATVSQAAEGRPLHIRCHRCEATFYAGAGTRAARLVREKMTTDADEAAPAPAGKKASKPAPAAAAEAAGAGLLIG